MSNTNLIRTLSLWTEFNTVADKGYKICGLTSPIQPPSIACNLAKSCERCFFKVDRIIQDKTIESLDRHTGWKI